MSKKEFNEFRFSGLNARSLSNKYMTMDRVSEDGKKIVVKVGSSHLFPTKYGYGLILNHNHVAWLKTWQVSMNYFGNEVLLDEDYFKPVEWGTFWDFDEGPECESFGHWLGVAEAQKFTIEEDGETKLGNPVRWEK